MTGRTDPDRIYLLRARELVHVAQRAAPRTYVRHALRRPDRQWGVPATHAVVEVIGSRGARRFTRGRRTRNGRRTSLSEHSSVSRGPEPRSGRAIRSRSGGGGGPARLRAALKRARERRRVPPPAMGSSTVGRCVDHAPSAGVHDGDCSSDGIRGQRVSLLQDTQDACQSGSNCRTDLQRKGR